VDIESARSEGVEGVVEAIRQQWRERLRREKKEAQKVNDCPITVPLATPLRINCKA